VTLSAIISSELHVGSSPTFAHVTYYGRCAVLLWRRNGRLRVSGFLGRPTLQSQVGVLSKGMNEAMWFFVPGASFGQSYTVFKGNSGRLSLQK